LKIQIQNVVSVVFNQSFDIESIARAFPRNSEFKARFPGLVFRLDCPKVAVLIFQSGRTVCSGAKSVGDTRNAVSTVLQELKGAGFNVEEKPEIRVVNIVASITFDRAIDLDGLYLKIRPGRIVYEPEQFPALICHFKRPKVAFLIFSTGECCLFRS